MLKARVVPTLLWKNFGLVKGIGFDSWRRIGTAMPAMKVYNTRDVDELILLDIAATIESSDLDYASVEELAAECFVPLTVGGGVDSLDRITGLLRAGADKVSINSAAFDRPEFISEAAARFGAQCIVASIDVRRRPDGAYECFGLGGRRATGWDPADWAAELERLGAGEILLTAVERDGTMEGYDVGLIRRVSDRVSVPVIASGGAGTYAHMYEALRAGGAGAVAAASMFHFTQQTPAEAKRYLGDRGVPVRNGNTVSAALGSGRAGLVGALGAGAVGVS